MDAYEEEFMSDVAGANKHAVKRLTRTLEVELLKASVNAPDW
jgi:glycerol-3-phosphate O-acyltransferase/dihydroxyacetone phosphate acyltransferase